MGARESSPPRPPPETPKPASKELERKNPLSDSDQKRLSKRISDVLANNTALNHRVQSTTANNVGKRRLSISSSVRLIKEALENLGVLTIMKDEMAKIVNSEEFSDISFFISSQKSPFYAHKYILSSRSEYFRDLFHREPDIKEIEIDKYDKEAGAQLEPQTFLSFLRFLYLDTVDEVLHPKQRDWFDALVKKYFPGKDTSNSSNVKQELGLHYDILNDNHLSDVILEVGEERERFFAHRVILAARSEYFHALFSGNWKEGQQEVVHITTLSPVSFVQVLQFMYTDNLGIPSLNSCLELFYFGSFYSIPTLQWVCERYVTESVCADNVCELWNFALDYNLQTGDSIAERCFFYTASNFITVVGNEKDDFLSLRKEALARLISSKDILALCDWSTPTMVVAKVLYDWVEFNLRAKLTAMDEQLMAEAQEGTGEEVSLEEGKESDGEEEVDKENVDMKDDEVGEKGVAKECCVVKRRGELKGRINELAATGRYHSISGEFSLLDEGAAEAEFRSLLAELKPPEHLAKAVWQIHGRIKKILLMGQEPSLKGMVVEESSGSFSNKTLEKVFKTFDPYHVHMIMRVPSTQAMYEHMEEVAVYVHDRPEAAGHLFDTATKYGYEPCPFLQRTDPLHTYFLYLLKRLDSGQGLASQQTTIPKKTRHCH